MQAPGHMCLAPRRLPWILSRGGRLALAAGLAWATLPIPLHAQSVPQLINYQGRVAVSGVNFNGSGQFKFALVNASGSQTYLSNDGSSAAGSPPANAVSLPVANGLYSVLLGDASLAGMTVIPAGVFANSDVRLRVWFSEGANGSQLLTPDQRIAAAGYALMAEGVRAGGITSSMIANGTVGSAQIAAGAVGSSQLAAGAATGNIASGSLTGAQLAGGAAAAKPRRLRPERRGLGRPPSLACGQQRRPVRRWLRQDRLYPAFRRLDPAHERHPALRALCSHRGLDWHRNDRLGRSELRWTGRRRALQPGRQFLDRPVHERRSRRALPSHGGVDRL